MTIKTPLALLALAGAASLFALVPLGGAAKAGLKLGESVTAFHPRHLSGPLAGTTNCFPCTFQNRPQTQIWVHGDSEANVGAVAKMLDGEMTSKSGKEFKALVVVLYDKGGEAQAEAFAKAIPGKYGAKRVGVAVLPTTSEYVANYKIDLKAKNTVYVYKDWKVTAAYADVNAAKDGARIASSIDAITR